MERKKRNTRERAKEHEAKKPALEYWEWNRTTSDGPDVLTIKDVNGFKPGERILFLSMHRNLACAANDGVSDKPRKAEKFFKRNRDSVIYIHEEGMRGRLIWPWDENKEERPFEFDIQYNDKGCWTPLENGAIGKWTDGTPPDYSSMFEGYIENKRWSEFPDDTCVGWRGPMLRWDLLKNQPAIFCNQDLANSKSDSKYPDGYLEYIEDESNFEAEAIAGKTKINQDRIIEIRKEGDEWLVLISGLTGQQKKTYEKRMEGAVFWPHFPEHTDESYARLYNLLDDGGDDIAFHKILTKGIAKVVKEFGPEVHLIRKYILGQISDIPESFIWRFDYIFQEVKMPKKSGSLPANFPQILWRSERELVENRISDRIRKLDRKKLARRLSSEPDKKASPKPRPIKPSGKRKTTRKKARA